MKIQKWIPYVLILLFFSSCEKYLDIKTSSTAIFIETPEDCQKILDNYTVMNVDYPSDGEASSDNYYLTDANYSSTNITQEDRGIYIWAPTVLRGSAKPQWQTPYYIIYNANLILEAVDKLKNNGTDPAITNPIRGSALFYRAYALWNVAQLYTKSYNSITSNQDSGIPIRLTSDINEVSSRGTVQQVYDQILKDLNESLTLLPTTAIVASRPSKIAVYAMLSRVYLSMENYTLAQTNADAALQIKNNLIDYNTVSESSNTPFQRFNTEVIFQSVTAQTNLLLQGNIYYNVSNIDSNLVSSYDTNDLRKSIFFKSLGSPVRYIFTGNYEPTTGGSFFNGLAVDELYLIRAECYARAGNASGAIADLNILLRQRWVTGTYIDLVASSADDALVKVLAERRKELLMRAQRWTDLRRLNKDSRFAKTLTRIVNGTTYTLPPNDLRYTLLIPNEVIRNNSAITQNPR